MNSPDTRGRSATIKTDQVQKLAPVLSATALFKWFNGLPSEEGIPTRSRPVLNLDGGMIGYAALRQSSTTVIRYSQTVSVALTSTNGGPNVTVRGRRLAVPLEPPLMPLHQPERRTWPPETKDLDYIGAAAGYALAWKRRNAVQTDLIAVGSHFKGVCEPAVATVETIAMVPFTEVEQAMLDFGGVLLAAAEVQTANS